MELWNHTGNLIDYMMDGIFTLSTLYCTFENGVAKVHDLTGRGLDDLEHMRLVMLKNPDKQFVKDPTGILFVLKYCLKGFNPDEKIVNALKNLQSLDHDYDRKHFNVIVQKQLLKMNLADRKKYVRLFAQYDLLDKLFNIKYECNVIKSLTELEGKLGVPSLMAANNQNHLYAGTNTNNIKPTIVADNRMRLPMWKK